MDLTWNSNYGRFSKSYYGYLWNGKDFFLEDPDKVSESGLRSLNSALWLYMTPRDNMPSPHDVVIRRWIPNAFDAEIGAT